MILDMLQINDMRRLWSEGCDVTEIARITGHSRKTVSKYLGMNYFLVEELAAGEESVKARPVQGPHRPHAYGRPARVVQAAPHHHQVIRQNP